MGLNRSGQYRGPIAFIILICFFVALWFMGIGEFVSWSASFSILQSGWTGVEAFLIGNLNVWIFVFSILGIMGFMYFGSRQ